MLSYPLDLSFKIVTIGTRIRIKDATGRQVAYVRKRKLKLREDVRVYEDENQSRLLFRMKADRMIDFSARYAVSGPDGHPIGAVGRRGMKSLWSSAYVLVDAYDTEAGSIREENPWTKVLDGMMESLREPWAASSSTRPTWRRCMAGTCCAYRSNPPSWRAASALRSSLISPKTRRTCCLLASS